MTIFNLVKINITFNINSIFFLFLLLILFFINLFLTLQFAKNFNYIILNMLSIQHRLIIILKENDDCAGNISR